jgi:hypothetical protein
MDDRTLSVSLWVDGVLAAQTSLLRDEAIFGLWLSTASAVLLEDTRQAFAKLRFSLSGLALFSPPPNHMWLQGRNFSGKLD